MRRDLSRHEEALVSLCERGIAEGRALADWCRASDRGRQAFSLDPRRECALPHKSEAFYGEVVVDGRKRSVMACVQRMRMGTLRETETDNHVREFVMRDFLASANWIYSSGKR